MAKEVPYTVSKDGDKWCVYEKSTGKKVDEFSSRMEAMRKVRELMKHPVKPADAEEEDEE